jgi:hypothetical protein
MRTPSFMRSDPDPVTVTLNLPVLDDAAAVMIYNFPPSSPRRPSARRCTV